MPGWMVAFRVSAEYRSALATALPARLVVWASSAFDMEEASAAPATATILVRAACCSSNSRYSSIPGIRVELAERERFSV